MSRRDLPALAVAQPVSMTVPSIPLNYVNPGMSLNQVIAIIWAYRKQTLIIALALTVLAGVVSKLSPKSYTAIATLIVDTEMNDPLASRDQQNGNGLVASYMNTQIELMQIPAVLLPVVDRLNLTANKKYAAGYKPVTDEPGGTAMSLREWVGQAIGKNLVVEQGRNGSQLINITYTGSNAMEAAQIANAVADVYSEQVYERVNGPAAERAKRYTEELADLKEKVDRAQDQVTAFRQSTGLIQFESRTNAETGILDSLEQRLQEAQTARRAAEVKAASDQSVGSEVINSNVVQTLKSQLAEQQSRMDVLKTTLGAKHPDVVQLQLQIDATKRSLGSAMGIYSGNASNELAAARQLEAKTQKAVDEQRQKVLLVHQQQDEGAKYLVALESAQAVYKRALDGYDQIMFASNSHSSNVSFVSRATPPDKASKPKTMKNVMMGAVAGLFLGIIGPLVYELFNRRIRCRDDIERDHGLPVLVEFDAIPARGFA